MTFVKKMCLILALCMLAAALSIGSALATASGAGESALGANPVSPEQQAAYDHLFNEMQMQKGFYSSWSLEERAKLTELKKEHGVARWYEPLDGLPGPDSLTQEMAVSLADERLLSGAGTLEDGTPSLTREMLDTLYTRSVYYKVYQDDAMDRAWWVEYCLSDPSFYEPEPYNARGEYVVPEGKTSLYSMHAIVSDTRGEPVTEWYSANADVGGMVMADEILQLLVAKLGPYGRWTLEQRAEYTALQKTYMPADAAMMDSLPGADDLPMEQAIATAELAIEREYGLKPADLERFQRYVYFWVDYSVDSGGTFWSDSNMWTIIYEGLEQDDIDTYESIYVRVHSPSGSVVETFLTLGGNG